VCEHEAHDKRLAATKPNLKSSLSELPHYLLLDTNIILDQIDVLEENAICNVIVLQTVLDEVKNKSSAVYKRFREILSNTERNFYVFVNEHHK
jgi:exosome complex exonuclease DIS3/RRP44